MKLLLHSPVGLLLAEYEPDVVHALSFWRQGDHPPTGTRDEPARGDELGRRLTAQLAEYFAGERRGFDLPLRRAASPFQAAVRAALCRIPYAEVRSHAEIAAALGHPRAASAVARASASNPFPILVPCHRAVPSRAKPGAEVERRRWLREMELRGRR